MLLFWRAIEVGFCRIFSQYKFIVLYCILCFLYYTSYELGSYAYFHLTDPPDSPRVLRLTDVYKDYITITWEAPTSNGGSPVTLYLIEKLDTTRPGASWVVAGTVEASMLKYKVAKLFQGNSYLVRVSAENQVGTSVPVELDRPVVAKLPFGK